MHNLDESMRGGTCCLGAAGMAEGTNDATIQFATEFAFCIDGLTYWQAVEDNVVVTVCTEQALGTTCLYLVSTIADGTITTTKGAEILTADLAAGNHVLQWPVLPALSCPIGKFKIQSGDTAFHVGVDDLTGDLDAAGLVYWADLMAVPAEPETT